MSVTSTPKTATCPTCSETVQVVEWTREPRETTFEQAGVPMWRTFVPGPFTDVILSCGHEVHGTAGVALIETLATS
jgi:hypothetical protein